MKKNRIILAVLATSLLLGQPMVAKEQTQASPKATPGAAKPEQVSRLKKEIQEFRDALKCVRQKGFRGCTRAQKKRIVAAGIAFAVIVAGTGYGIKRGVIRRQRRILAERAEVETERELQLEREELDARLLKEYKENSTNKQLDIIERGLQEEASPNLEQKLSIAIYKGFAEAVEKLITLGANVNDPQWIGVKHGTLLHYALSLRGSVGIKILKLLISGGADLEKENDSGKTPLAVAEWRRGEESERSERNQSFFELEKVILLLKEEMEARK